MRCFENNLIKNLETKQKRCTSRPHMAIKANRNNIKQVNTSVPVSGNTINFIHIYLKLSSIKKTVFVTFAIIVAVITPTLGRALEWLFCY